MDKKDEKRNLPRVEVKWPITIFTDNDTMEGESRNITTEGLYICCDKPLPLKDVFRMTIKPPHHQAIGVTGKIVWSDLYGLDDDKGVYCMGICLVEITDEEKRLLNDMVSAYL